MNVYIPTRMRPMRQPAVEACKAAGIPFTLVLSDVDTSYAEYVELYGKSVIATTSAKGICDTRNACLDIAKGRRHSKILMLDDDVRFYARDKWGKFFKSDVRDLKRMFAWFDKALDTYAHAGITDKFMCQTKPRGTVEHGRYNQALGYNLKLWPKGTRFRIPVNEEHDMHLQLATQGRPPIISNEWSKDAPYYAKGGCSTWRTPKVEKRGMDDMLKLWPGYVRLVANDKQISKLAIRVRWKAAVENNRVTK
jgi:hypothetical protein